MTTCEPLPDGGEDDQPLTLWPEDSLASLSVSRVVATRRTTLGGSGPRWPLSFAIYDPGSSSWRTSSDCLLPGLAMSSVTWPLSGSMRSGACSPRAPWVRHTHGSGCSLWATPQAADSWIPTTTSENTLRRGDPNGSLRTRSGALAKQVSGRPNPTWVEWLMGYPPGWTETDCGD